MPKSRRKLPDFNNPIALLKSVICGKCGDVRLGACDNCALTAQINRENPELTAAGNWHLRSAASKKNSYKARYQKRLYMRIYKLDTKIRLLQGNQDSRSADSRINKLLQKQEVLGREYEALLNEAASITEQKQSEDQPKKDAKEILIDQLQSLTAIAQQLANDELRFRS